MFAEVPAEADKSFIRTCGFFSLALKKAEPTGIELTLETS